MLPDLSAAHIFMLVVVALVVVGPKDLPVLLRKIGQFMARLRGMANEFRASFDEMSRQSELDELRREVAAMRAMATQPMQELRDAADSLHGDLNHGLEDFSGAPPVMTEVRAASTPDPVAPSLIPEQTPPEPSKAKSAAKPKVTAAKSPSVSRAEPKAAGKAQIAKPTAAKTVSKKAKPKAAPEPGA